MVHTSQYLHWQTQTHSIPPNSNSLVYTMFTQNLGSEQNFQQFIGKFVVHHFYHIVLFCCIAKSIYSAIPYDVFVYDGWLPSLSYNKSACNLYLLTIIHAVIFCNGLS